MQRGVDPHARMADGPVEAQADRVADGREPSRGRRDVGDRRTVRAVDGIGNGDLPAVGQRDPADVAGLAATLGIEDGAIENDAAVVVDADDGRLGRPGIGIVPEQKGRLAHCLPPRNGWATVGGAFRYRKPARGTSTRASHACHSRHSGPLAGGRGLRQGRTLIGQHPPVMICIKAATVPGDLERA